MSYHVTFTMQAEDGRQVFKFVDWLNLKDASHNIPYHILRELELELDQNDTKKVVQKPKRRA